MSLKFLSLETYLSEIDSDNKLNKKEVLIEILSVTLIKSIRKASELLNHKQRNEVLNLIDPNFKFNLHKIFGIFENNKKSEELQNTIRETLDELQKDYIKTQLKSLNNQKKKTVFEKFPELSELLR